MCDSLMRRRTLSCAKISTPSFAIAVPVRVDDGADGLVREGLDRGLDLGRQRGVLIVDHHHAISPGDHAEIAAPASQHPDPFSELLVCHLDLVEVLRQHRGGRAQDDRQRDQRERAARTRAAGGVGSPGQIRTHLAPSSCATQASTCCLSTGSATAPF